MTDTPTPAAAEAYLLWLADGGAQGATVETAFYCGWQARGPSAREIGQRGAAAMLARAAPGHMATIGHKGGAVAKARMGTAGYRAAGKLGGEATKKKHGSAHYAALGRRTKGKEDQR